MKNVLFVLLVSLANISLTQNEIIEKQNVATNDNSNTGDRGVIKPPIPPILPIGNPKNV